MRFRLLALVALVAGIVRPVAAQIPGGGVTVQPVAEKASVAAGESLRLALDVKVPPGLHLQADRPRDKAVIPARLALKTPTGVAFAANGDIFVSDGYGNRRVHCFAPDGTLKHSWGEPGTGPGQFALVHFISADADDPVKSMLLKRLVAMS